MINLGLKRITRLLQHISQTQFHQPQFNPPWKAVHIAGTNGKGSVAAYLSALLRRQGRREDGKPLRVGRFTSPHFIDRWDCICINDQPVAEDVFLRAERDVKAIATRVEEELREEARNAFSGKGFGEERSIEQIEKDARPTEFEILTAIAFTIFSQAIPETCDIAVVECGLGGRLDATNVLPDSAIAVSVITSIGLDHVDMLGGSLGSIVREKCGIVRTDVPVVINADRRSQATEMVKAEIEGRFEHKDIASNDDAIARLTIETRDTNHARTEQDYLHDKQPSMLSLLPHQRSNFALALTAFDYAAGAVRKQDKNIGSVDSKAIWEDIIQDASKSYPARLQMLQPGWLEGTGHDQDLPSLNGAEVLLDGAHNTQSARVLRDFVNSQVLTRHGSNHNGRPEIWIIALSSTKPPAEVLGTLFTQQQVTASDSAPSDPTDGSLPPSETTRVIFTSFGPVDGMPWVKPASTEVLLQCATELGLSQNVEAITSNIVEALDAVETSLNVLTGKAEREQAHEPCIVIAGSLYLCSDFLRYTLASSAGSPGHQDANVRAEISAALAFEGSNRRQSAILSITAESCSWVWDAGLRDFLEGPENIFWISGKPGSVLFDYKSGEAMANTIEGLLRSLVDQLSRSCSKSRELIQESEIIQSGANLGTEVFIDLITRIVDTENKRFCAFVDGIDEYSGNQPQLVTILLDMQERTGIKLCLASRNIPAFETRLRGRPGFKMQDYNSHSITSYLVALTEELAVRFKNPCPQEVVELIEQRAAGVVLWARFAFANILEGCVLQEPVDTLKDRVAELPREMEGLYWATLQRVPCELIAEAALCLFLIDEADYLMSTLELLTLVQAAVCDYPSEIMLPKYLTLEQFEYRLCGMLGGLVSFIGQSPVQYLEEWDIVTREISIRRVPDEVEPEEIRTVETVHETMSAYLAKSAWVWTRLPSVFCESVPGSILKLYSTPGGQPVIKYNLKFVEDPNRAAVKGRGHVVTNQSVLAYCSTRTLLCLRDHDYKRDACDFRIAEVTIENLISTLLFRGFARWLTINDMSSGRFVPSRLYGAGMQFYT
ncbi:folylpolyglutamate synthase [Knufia fluminis]|uniref:Folylpolyglutamate synthase n=1 Tax=Knufia fluminis TaxID=191047 RepID=A0AAN8ICL3_9EURO|nr:folylpolyglutamate synthase [Knufia fluminis]